MSDVEANARELIGVLNHFKVDYILVGGVALQAHGVAHVTQDVDVVIAPGPDNHGPLGEALQALRAEQRAVGKIGQSFDTSLGVLDVLDFTDGTGDYDAWNANATEVQLGDAGPTVRVGSIADVKHDKTVIGRGKDRTALELIERFERGQERSPTPAELLLGPRPTEPEAQQRWDLVARMVDHFRERHDITTIEPLGADAHGPDVVEERGRILRLVEQVMPEAGLGEPGLGGEIEL